MCTDVAFGSDIALCAGSSAQFGVVEMKNMIVQVLKRNGESVLIIQM